jgi:hypothetical protein
MCSIYFQLFVLDGILAFFFGICLEATFVLEPKNSELFIRRPKRKEEKGNYKANFFERVLQKS